MAKTKTRVAEALTAKAIDAMKPDPDDAYSVPDLRCRGLSIRVATDGGKTWSTAYRIKGKGVKRYSLGRYEDVGLEAMRNRANDLTKAGREGRDLIAKEEADRDEHQQSYTLERVVLEYAKRRLKGRLKTANETERRLRRALASLMQRKAIDIRRRDLRELLDKVADKSHVAEADKQRTNIQTMFRWALRQDIVETDPSTGLSPYGQLVARDRVLNPDEIRELWSWLGTGDMPVHGADTLKLQMCLGARVGEICGMTADELKHNGAGLLLWSLPAARSKNGSGRVTPIVGLALEILEQRLKAASKGDGRLFASRAGTSPNAGLIGKAIWARRSRMPIAEFRSHDLRRTVATEMVKLGLPLETVALILGHQAKASERTLQKHYVHDEFVDRKAHALAVWDRRLRTILSGEDGKVISLRA